MSRRMDALFTASLSYLICQTFSGSRIHCAQMQKARSRSPRRSSRISRRKWGSRWCGCSRGIALGADLPHAEWEKRINHSLETFESSPTIMQRFHKGRLVEHQYRDPDSNELKTMKGRVRLCPYYFVESDRVKLRGALATI